MDKSKITNVQIDGMDFKDHPDYVDAFISYAEYDGRPCTDEEMEEINEDAAFVYEKVWAHLH